MTWFSKQQKPPLLYEKVPSVSDCPTDTGARLEVMFKNGHMRIRYALQTPPSWLVLRDAYARGDVRRHTCQVLSNETWVLDLSEICLVLINDK